MNRFFIPALLLLLFCHGCASPPHRELEAARAALAEAHSLGAAELAPARYRTAREVLENSEAFMAEGQYRQARESLPYAETLARQAIAATHEERKRRISEARSTQERLQGLKEQQLREEAQHQPGPTISDRKPSRSIPAPGQTQIKGKAAPASRPTDVTPPAPALPSSYTVIDGETLWIIAGKKEIYQDPLLWPLLYRANRDQIKDPRRVYGGQTLTIPRNQSESDLAEARATARESDAFPIAPRMNAGATPDTP
ncbi:MAG: LysM peptidoglycan-binding domain-containing protein [Trichloromonas sp.]|jgi:nucleoid-associated protein YgaU|nr:LysM peptidoglycan-binding domain-containing protein [Trichloromonas sp.]